MTRSLGLFLFLSICLTLSASADLTIVQKVEGVGPTADVTIKIKGDKARIDVNPQLTTIIDGKTGEMTNLMKDQKTLMRISANEMKAAADMLDQFTDKNVPSDKPRLNATGKKETINGYETEEYVCETPMFKAAYFIAPKYPDGAAILKQLQVLKSEALNPTNVKMPDYRDFPGLPIKTVVSMGANQVTTTLTSVKQDPLNDAEFSIPKDFQETKLPDIGSLLKENEKEPATNASPKP
jgi:hypothetical protein